MESLAPPAGDLKIAPLQALDAFSAEGDREADGMKKAVGAVAWKVETNAAGFGKCHLECCAGEAG
jgi:hypothetical protein